MKYKTSTEKTIFRFSGCDRSAFRFAEIGAELTVQVLDEDGNIVSLPFRVTRNAALGSQRWIYGQVLGAPEGRYYQIEFRLHPDDPAKDTAEMFLQAPPLKP